MNHDFGVASIPDGLIVVFLSIVLVVTTFSSINNDKKQAYLNEQFSLDDALDSANDSALDSLIEQVDASQNTKLHKEQAVETFFKTLSSRLEVNPSDLKPYVPVCCVLDNDGFFLYHAQEVVEGNHYAVQYVWSRKFPYRYSNGSMDVVFRLDGTASVYDKQLGKVFQGLPADLAQCEGSPQVRAFFADEEAMKPIRAKAIVSDMTEQFQLAINEHNKTAKQAGLQYRFRLPVIEDSEWVRIIEDISFLSFFQGYTFNDGSLYNSFSFSGSRLHKAIQYYGQEENGVKLYHRASCSRLTNKDLSFDSKKESAEQGYYPCTHCNP